ncbi:MAG: lamin tail domain-containing protein [Bacteroidetes bacterium]|nr:lamin tail domain-containing protein [Bacteroidota bacterium]
MKKLILFFITLSTYFIFPQSDTSLTLTEIMFNPLSGNNEFIEVFNTSFTNSIDLKNFKIKYYTSTPDTFKSAGFGTILPPQSYAIIFELDYNIDSGIYKNLVPISTLILKISDGSFGSSGMSNTTSRPILLLNAQGDMLESYTYSANNSTGFSDEKIHPTKNNSIENWGNSIIQNGTPGFKNSISPANFDLMLSSINISSTKPKPGDEILISAKVKNIGETAADNCRVEIYNDENFDSTVSSSELLYANEFSNLQPGDSLNIPVNFIVPQQKEFSIIAKVIFDKDEFPSNNQMTKIYPIALAAAKYNDIVINEIMYAPTSGEPEWIEIFNTTTFPINLNGWRIGDNSTSTSITSKDIIVQPFSYFIISKDSTLLKYFSVRSQIVVTNFPSLNNSGDAVVLKDPSENIVDSLEYRPAWGGNSNGKSLERINFQISSTDSSNWKTSSSKQKATPGYINSVSPKDSDIEITDIIFSPSTPFLNDTVLVFIKIKNNGKNSTDFSLRLFEDKNLDSVYDSYLSTTGAFTISPFDSLIINLNYSIKNFNSTKAFYVEAASDNDQDTSNNYFYKTISPGYHPGSVLINEIMYYPSSGEPEWIEIYNTASDSINLKSWSITDVLTTPVTVQIKNNFNLSPKSYLVISRDSSIVNFHRIIPSNILTLNLPVLNNDADGVVIKDNHGITIDSVFYRKDEGGIGGNSLERKSLNVSSLLSANWNSSNDLELSTPGRINSITPKQFDLILAEISSDPKFPVSGENVFPNVKVKNLGSSQVSNFEIEFYIDTDSNGTADKLLNRQSGVSINSGDSIIITSSVPILNLNSRILAAAKIILPNDEDQFNNYDEKILETGFAQNSLLINEVMFSPIDNEPEWIELVNVSNENLKLKNWFVSDMLPTPTKNFISNEDLFLAPGEYFVITKDSSIYSFHPELKSSVRVVNFGSLSNSEDGIIIYDFRNGIIDSLHYKSTWGGLNGYSLERFSLSAFTNDSSNWTTSLSELRSTPGEINSVLTVPSYKRNDLIINELMFDPDIDNNEFIEFVNLKGTPVNIGGWSIADESGNSIKLSDVSFNVPGNSFFLLAADSSVIKKYNLYNFPIKNVLNISNLGLSNEGELLLLKDLKGNIIDSLNYSAKWHNKNFTSTKNISLEKINPQINGNLPGNWSSSASSFGATPGKQNSIYAVNLNNESKISVSPNPFSPDNDGFEDFTIINYILTQATSQVRIKIFDSRGRLVRTLINNQASGRNGSIIFNGLDDGGNALRIGMYIIFLEALNDNNGSVENLKTIIVVARKLN